MKLGLGNRRNSMDKQGTDILTGAATSIVFHTPNTLLGSTSLSLSEKAVFLMDLTRNSASHDNAETKGAPHGVSFVGPDRRPAGIVCVAMVIKRRVQPAAAVL
jgi:hypothetical protein